MRLCSASVGSRPIGTWGFTVRRGSYDLPLLWHNAVEDWLQWMRLSGHSPRTRYTRRGHVRAVARKLQLRSPADVTGEHLIFLFSQEDWSLEHRRGMRTSLVQFFDHCMKSGVVRRNPASALPKMPESKPKPRPAPEWLWQELIDKAGPRELLMIRLAGEAGLRRAEIAQVHRDDVLWDGDGWALIVHGKGDKQRVVPINTALAEQIQRGPVWLPEHLRHGHLFPSVDQWGNVVAKHLSPDRVGRLMSDLMPEGYTAHKLRHRYATRGFAGTKNLRAVQEALGHASVATTQRYVAVSSPEVRAVSVAVAGA